MSSAHVCDGALLCHGPGQQEASLAQVGRKAGDTVRGSLSQSMEVIKYTPGLYFKLQKGFIGMFGR